MKKFFILCLMAFVMCGCMSEEEKKVYEDMEWYVNYWTEGNGYITEINHATTITDYKQYQQVINETIQFTKNSNKEYQDLINTLAPVWGVEYYKMGEYHNIILAGYIVKDKIENNAYTEQNFQPLKKYHITFKTNEYKHSIWVLLDNENQIHFITNYYLYLNK